MFRKLPLELMKWLRTGEMPSCKPIKPKKKGGILMPYFLSGVITGLVACILIEICNQQQQQSSY